MGADDGKRNTAGYAPAASYYGDAWRVLAESARAQTDPRLASAGMANGVSLPSSYGAEPDAARPDLVIPDLVIPNLVINGGTTYDISGVVHNTGGILMKGGIYDAYLIVSGPSATLTGGGLVIMGPNAAYAGNFIEGASAGDVLVNLNNTIEGYGQLGNGKLTMVNAAKGVIIGDEPKGGNNYNGLVINLGGQILTNDGLITTNSANGRTPLHISSTTIDGTGGGTILAAGDANIEFGGVDIQGGVLATAGGGLLVVDAATFDGTKGAVHNTGTVHLQGAGSPNVGFVGQIDNTGLINFAVNTGGFACTATIEKGGATLSGGGEVYLDVAGGNNIIGAAASYFLTNLDNTIAGAGQIGSGKLSIVNDAKGVFDATGGYGTDSMIVSSGSGTIFNHGLMEGTGVAGLIIGNGTVVGAGGGVILAGDGSHVLLNGDFQGGTFKTAGSGFNRMYYGALDGTKSEVVNTGAMQVVRDVDVTGVIANSGSITLETGAPHGAFSIGAQGATLTGGGQVYLNNGDFTGVAPGDTLTILSNTVDGFGQVGNGGSAGAGLNIVVGAKGVIDANIPGIYNALFVNPGAGQSVVNQGLLEATNGQHLLIYGLVTGTGGGIILAGQGSQVELHGTAAGQTIASSGTGFVFGYDATLDGRTSAVSVTGSLVGHGGFGPLSVEGVIHNTGTIGFFGNYSAMQVLANTTITGAGALRESGAPIYGASSSTKLTNAGNTITAFGTIFQKNITFINTSGVVDANYGSALILTTPGHVIGNSGTLEATGSGGLVIQSAVISGAGGTVFAGAGAHVSLQSSTINGGAADDVLATAATGVITIGDGSRADVQGTLNNAGTIAVASSGAATSLRLFGAGASLTGGGTVTLGGGGARIYGAKASAVLTNVDNTISGIGAINDLTLTNQAKGVIEANGAGALTIDTAGQTLANAGLIEAVGAPLLLVATTINQSAGGTIAAAGGRVELRDDHILGGTLASSAAGVLDVDQSGGSLDGSAGHAVTIAGALAIANKTSLTIVGSIVNSGTISLDGGAATTELLIGAGGAILAGGGRLKLSNASANLVGATAAATLTNVDDTVSGAGTIGDANLTLVNKAAGLIVSSGSAGLILTTGANVITNVGTLQAGAGGGLTVKSAIANSGLLYADDGTLMLAGAVTGAGSAKINGGTLDAASTFTEDVTFAGKTGVLELAKSQSYSGKVTGLSLSGTSSLDLLDIKFISASKTTATFVDNGKHTGGVLTVTDGTHTAKITLVGNYSTARFVTSSDGHGGTSIVDPSSTPQATPAHFAAAMAAFAATAAPPPPAAQSPPSSVGPPLIAPRP